MLLTLLLIIFFLFRRYMKIKLLYPIIGYNRYKQCTSYVYKIHYDDKAQSEQIFKIFLDGAKVGQYYSVVPIRRCNHTLHRWRRLNVGYYFFIFHLFIVNRTRTRVITGIVCRILWTLMLLSKQFFFRLTIFNMSYGS